MHLVVIFTLTLGTACFAAESQQVISEQASLKKQCLAATVTAINLEIDRHQRWIDYRLQQGDQQAVDGWQEAITALKADLARYSSMKAEDYTLPEPIETNGWCNGKADLNSTLYFDGMTKNGPWYHLAGIAGDDYTALSSKNKQHMVIYPVYPRSYWNMNSAYLYIGAISPAVSDLIKASSIADSVNPERDKRIFGEVYAYQYNDNLLYDIKKCENYQIYLLKANDQGSSGELLLDSRQSAFDIILSEQQLKDYSYLEFVSAYNSKIIKISDIKDEPLKIILEPEVFLKKPAIYLYPAEKTKITVTHYFKGTLLTTYPEYTNNWTVIAEPNGDLLNVQDNRYYKYLFWDGTYTFPQEHFQYKSGFYVKKQDYVSFLQSKLAAIGLNENEINDFIVYWLPSMKKYNNCFIHFRINDNIGGSSILAVKPEPATIIRVFMEFSGAADLSSVPKLPEQSLPSFARNGFTLVEWGGTEIGSNKLE